MFGFNEQEVPFHSFQDATIEEIAVDERGSVVAVSGASGQALAVNRYDDHGVPQAGNLGRFQYTGQQWLAELGMYHYRARMYNPALGRFMQEDPIGYAGGMNLYAYVGGDPVNFADPSGLDRCITTGSHICQPRDSARPDGLCTSCSGSSGSYVGGVWGTGSRGGLRTRSAAADYNSDSSTIVVKAFPTSSTLPFDLSSLPGASVWQPQQFAQRILPPRIGPPPAFYARPPAGLPRPPGWNNRWTFRHPEGTSRGSRGEPRWYDPQGGSWRWHPADRYHRPHWDYNPHDYWNSPSIRVYPRSPNSITPGQQWQECIQSDWCA